MIVVRREDIDEEVLTRILGRSPSDWRGKRVNTKTRRTDQSGPFARRIGEMSKTRRNSVRMCHAHGKTAVYLSDDGQQIVEHEPNGTIRKKRLIDK